MNAGEAGRADELRRREALATLSRWFPRAVCWWGMSTGRWWAMWQEPDGWRMQDAASVQELATRINAGGGRPMQVGKVQRTGWESSRGWT